MKILESPWEPPELERSKNVSKENEPCWQLEEQVDEAGNLTSVGRYCKSLLLDKVTLVQSEQMSVAETFEQLTLTRGWRMDMYWVLERPQSVE